jgi:hypothetical protein
MYVRLVALIAIFNRRLLASLAPAFLILATVAIAAGWLWSRRAEAPVQHPGRLKPFPGSLGSAGVDDGGR